MVVDCNLCGEPASAEHVTTVSLQSATGNGAHILPVEARLPLPGFEIFCVTPTVPTSQSADLCPDCFAKLRAQLTQVLTALHAPTLSALQASSESPRSRRSP